MVQRTGVAAAVLIVSGTLWAGRLTPPDPPVPRIHGARLYGARPGHPFLYRIPATGERPMTFTASGLPSGLELDRATGIIRGTTPAAGQYTLRLRAKNRRGTASKRWTIVAGPRLALTPPMGYSTWYHCYMQVTDRIVRASTDAMLTTGLADHGYDMVTIDDGWNRRPARQDPEHGPPVRDAAGNLLPNATFPDMPALVAYIHSKGLKAGIYTGPGALTCGRCAASLGHEEQDARQFARWGFDQLKYDWCSYSKYVHDGERLTAPGLTLAQMQAPYRLMGTILGRLDRDVLFALCQYGMGSVERWGREVGGQSWRTMADLGVPRDGSLWKSVEAKGFGQAGLEAHAGPGGWNDPDNLLLGWIKWNRTVMPAPLSEDEQYSYMSLWSLLAAPLVLGGDPTRLDHFTLGLLSNDEVIAVNQDALGRQARRVAQRSGAEVWVKELEHGQRAVGLFNRGERPATVTARWDELGIQGRRRVRDLWRQKDLGSFAAKFEAQVPPHGVVLVQLR
jgi:alpha-galactosidase